MALVPVDSTNFTVSTNAVSTVSFGNGFRNLNVVNLNGGGIVGFRFDTSTSMTSTNALNSDNWILPAASGASWTHSLVKDDGDSSAESAPAFHVELCASNSVSTVAVTAWA